MLYRVYLFFKNIHLVSTRKLSYWILGISIGFLVLNVGIYLMRGAISPKLEQVEVKEDIVYVPKGVLDIEPLIKTRVEEGLTQEEWLGIRLNQNYGGVERDMVTLASIVNEGGRKKAIRDLNWYSSDAYGWLHVKDGSKLNYGGYTDFKAVKIDHWGKTYNGKDGLTTYNFVLTTTSYADNGATKIKREIIKITYKDGKIWSWEMG